MQYLYTRSVVKIQPTGDLELEAISWWVSSQSDPEASSGKERWQYVAHDVDLDLLLALELLPDDRVVEHTEFFSVELAVEVDRLSGVKDVNLTLCPHRQEHAESFTHTHTDLHTVWPNTTSNYQTSIAIIFRHELLFR